MDWYTIRLTLRGPVGTAWQADTIWGHLCWALRYEGGLQALAAFLDRYRQGDPPLVLSNGFPEGWLPRPLHLETPRVVAATASLAEQRAAFRTAKTIKGIDLIPDAVFRQVQAGVPWVPTEAALQPPRATVRVALKNQIDRMLGAAGGAGGALFGFVEYWPPRDGPATVVIYCLVAPDFVEDLELLVDTFQQGGYGKRRAVGYGAIERAVVAPFDGFATPAGANAFVSLSNFVPAAGDPVDGRWRTLVKYGKHGEERAQGPGAAPFKRPLIMLEAGAVFRDPTPRPWYGRVVDGVSAHFEDTVQYGLALALPLVWPERASAAAGE